MRLRILTSWMLCAICAALLWPAGADAATASSAARRRARASRSAKTAATKSAAAKDGKVAPSADGKPAGPRTLQDIHIEGEIPVPQVLFITARDQRRFVDFQTQRYLKTSQEVGEQTVLPSRIVVTGSRPADQPKETRP